MKFYVTRYTHNGAKRLTWQGTQEAAKQTRTGLAAVPTYMDISTIEFDVPTDKQGLLDFLNQYVTGELGAEQAAELFRQLGIPQSKTTPLP